MTEYGKAQIQAIGAGVIGFVVVVGAGAFLMFPHGSASVKAPASSYAPVDVNSGLSAPAPLAKPVRAAESAAPAVETAPQSSPAPLLSDDVRDSEQEAPAPAAAPQPAAPAPQAAVVRPSAPKLAVTGHLDGSSSAHSSARASVAAAPSKEAARPVKKTAAPKLDFAKAAQGAVASSVHYGVSDRAELMGRAAGPVYNFAGAGMAKGDAPQAETSQTAGTLDQVDSIQKDIDKSALSDADKATLKANLNNAARAVNASKTSQP